MTICFEQRSKRSNKIICIRYKVITACHSVRNAGQAGERIDINSEEYTKEKNAVLEAERIILYTINYELDSTPINPTLIFKNILSKLIETRIIDENNKSFMNNGVNIMWASLRTNLPLQFEPKKIASACAFLTTIYSKLMPKDKTKLNIFFKIIDTSERTLKAISQQVAEIYLDNEAADDFIVELATAGWIPQAMAERRIKNTRLDSSIVPPLKKIRSSPSITPTHFPSDAA
uniref:Cyclin N-terminal domain-containing protein n=1 Tax=Aureoumbra lagunensis TaxID=44058 RepID=A0A7S3NIZ9_9STRA|mmetsp:Transcript_14329/g.19150  ORF Transcript_14329/g.19150 Transcript_14329/m.19150 type:complete len:232 (-) Transcript_14329:311-1006(-)